MYTIHRWSRQDAVKPFELLLFSICVPTIKQAVENGVDGIIVDWEFRGKAERQRGADTQINQDTLEDLLRVRAATSATVIVRINGFGDATEYEIEMAISAGADEVLLPMVTTPDQAAATLEMVRGRAGVGILVETLDGAACAAELGRLALRRVYVGLNDLAIQRRSAHIFEPIVDGLLEAIRGKFQCPFGFGGLTLPEKGRPIPCRLLMGEMAGMATSFCFLRRSFLADTGGHPTFTAIQSIRREMAAMYARSAAAVERDAAALRQAIELLSVCSPGSQPDLQTATCRRILTCSESPPG